MQRIKLTGWRKIASALWDPPNDPQVYGALEFDATPLLACVERARELGERLTPTHLVGRAVAHAIRAVPELNVRLAGEYAVPRESIDIFFITSVARGSDLTGVKVEHADRKSALELARELSQRSQRMKRGEDPDLARSKRIMELLPRPLLRIALRGAAWCVGEHAMSIPWLGLAASPFGSAMVSSVGSLGLPMGFTPLVWMYHVPLLVLLGEITEKPIALSGRVEIRPMLPVTATIDHRYVDGAHLSKLLKAFREYLTEPSRYEATLCQQKVATRSA